MTITDVVINMLMAVWTICINFLLLSGVVTAAAINT